LTVTDNNNCTTSTTTFVSVVNPSLSVGGPDTLCLGDDFTPMLSSTEHTLQFIEPGSTPTVVPPNMKRVLKYPGPNVYTVTANPPYPCAAITKTFVVFAEELLVDFLTPPQKTCQNSLTATYTPTVTSNAPGPVSYTWMSKG